MGTSTQIEHPTVEERRSRGEEMRARTPHADHVGWQPAADRPDPVGLLEAQDASREPDLVPVRHGRMMASPFTFYRGAAKIMAEDLKGTPRAGLTTQLCGDAHLSNFGIFGSPERSLLFDLTDFDETLPGPFEYDVKRLAASFTIAGRNRGFSEADVQAATRDSVRAYREAMLGFAAMGNMDIWYAHLSERDLLKAIEKLVTGEKGSKAKKGAIKKAEKIAAKAKKRDSLHALNKLAEVVDGNYRIKAQSPIVVPLRDLPAAAEMSEDEIRHVVHEQFRAYRSTLQSDRRQLLERFKVIDVARKVVGVGSVGTRAYIVLLQGHDEHDPLFLQVKEAQRSVLEDHLPKSRFTQPGARVVHGQRMMQAASDIFLGWTKGVAQDRHLYWRQLRDMKGSIVVESMDPSGLSFYAGACGWTLARAHARSGDPIAMAAYLGKGDGFDRSITDFAERYADRNEEDFEAFVAAVRAGRLDAVQDV